MIFTSKGFINATQAAELMAAYPNRLSSIAYGNAAGDVIELVPVAGKFQLRTAA